MTKTKPSAKAQTVLGIIEGCELGVTLPHEHLVVDLSALFTEPSAVEERNLAYEPVSWKNLSWLHYHPLENLDNLRLLDERIATNEAMLFQKAGGNTIVDVTSIGMYRDPKALVRISQATGLNVIMGSGYYIGPSHGPALYTANEEELAEEIVRDIAVGIGDSGIRSGIIGEIGCSWPLQDNEKTVLRAAVLAQRRTGAPITVHPGLSKKAPFEVIEILGEAGADIRRVVMSHVDARITDHSERRKLADTGCYLEFDMWGWEGHFPPHRMAEGFLDLPNDTQRVYDIMRLIDDGYLNQILISHDICRKLSLTCYGGWGYAHISNYGVPMMLQRGMSKQQIDTFMVDNPKRLLCFL